MSHFSWILHYIAPYAGIVLLDLVIPYGPWTNCVGLTRELVSTAASQVPPRLP